MFEKIFLEQHKNRKLVPSNAPWKISIEDGVKVSGCWTVDHVIKKHWNFDEDFDFRGCGFFDVSKIVIFRDLTNVSYTVVYADSHCGNEEFLGRSKWSFMTKLHFLWSFRFVFWFVFRFFWCAKKLENRTQNLGKPTIFLAFCTANKSKN